MGPIDVRGPLLFLFGVGVAVGVAGVALATAAWRIGWWVWEHVQWVP